MLMRYLLLLTAVISLGVTGISGYFFIPYLRKVKYGQTIKEIGPTWHSGKQGTPTMGGLMFVLGIVLSLVAAGFTIFHGAESLFLELSMKNIITVAISFGATVGFGLIGFIDDYIKVAMKRNLGLVAGLKIIMQFTVTAFFLYGLHINDSLRTTIMIPYFGVVDLSYFFYIIAFLLIIGIVNAVNLTDGIDGLAPAVTFIVMMGYVAISILVYQFATGLFAAAVAGGMVGFLLWNFYPAKVFMGDTGSMFLGGAVATLAFCIGRPEILFLIGLLYMIEAASVILQVGYFKLTKRIYGKGRRIFRMSPIHHHFEMLGLTEIKIVALFCFIALTGTLAAILYIIIY